MPNKRPDYTPDDGELFSDQQQNLYDALLANSPLNREQMLSLLANFDRIGFEFTLWGEAEHLYISIPQYAPQRLFDLAVRVAPRRLLTNMIRTWLRLQRNVQRKYEEGVS